MVYGLNSLSELNDPHEDLRLLYVRQYRCRRSSIDSMPQGAVIYIHFEVWNREGRKPCACIYLSMQAEDKLTENNTQRLLV